MQSAAGANCYEASQRHVKHVKRVHWAAGPALGQVPCRHVGCAFADPGPLRGSAHAGAVGECWTGDLGLPGDSVGRIGSILGPIIGGGPCFIRTT
jgi:hypothetical protein